MSVSQGLAKQPRRVFRLVWKVYGYAIVMAILAVVPAPNLLLFFSAHGGIGWFLLPLALPFAIVRLVLLYRSARDEDKPFLKRFAALSMSAYIVSSLGISFLAANSMRGYLGFQVDALFLWGFFVFPIGLPFSWSFFFAD